MEIEKVRIGRWKVKIGTPKSPKVVERELLRKLERFLNREWKEAVLEEIDQPWWSLKYFGIPSPIVRIDMAPPEPPDFKNFKDFIYEVEVRPGGIGLMLSLFSGKAKDWKKIFSAFQCQGFVNIQSSIQDDKLAAKILGIPYYQKIPNKLKTPYWIRSDKRAGEITKFEEFSLVPIRLDGDKRYLVKLGMAKMLNKKKLDWSSPFVVKPLIGSRMEGVEIYLPGSMRRIMRGASTKSRIRGRISKLKIPYIVQKFIAPKQETIQGLRGWTIWRLYFGWQAKYKFLGGLWNWRPNLRVHGAPDAIFGTIEENLK